MRYGRGRRRKNPGLKTMLIVAAIIGGYYLWVASKLGFKLSPAPAKTGLPPGAANVLPTRPGQNAIVHGREMPPATWDV